MKNQKNRKAFTLIELLVVIAIIAVLSVVVILSLNPAELLRQSRDSNRISDMATLKSALSLYLADVAGPQLGGGTCYTSLNPGSSAFWTPNTSGVWASTTTCQAWMSSAGATFATTSIANQRLVSNGTSSVGLGWIPVNFGNISAGTPIGAEPVDAVNATGTGASRAAGALFYSYVASGTTFKLASFMESAKYATNGSADVESGDGGNNNYVYEQGGNLTL